MSLKKAILIINAGSSSLKFKIFHSVGLEVLASGQITGIGTEKVNFILKNNKNETLKKEELYNFEREQTVKFLLDNLTVFFDDIEIYGAGHRVVHGGENHISPVLIDSKVINDLKKIQDLSPIHVPHNIKPMEVLRETYPNIKQVACFDTAFHVATNPKHTRRYAIPKDLEEKDKIIKYGFHGLSYQYVSEYLKDKHSDISNSKVIICHLGAGASLCALQDGKAYTTTMGFTPLDGLVMGSRTGSIDPGVLLYLMNHKGYNADDLEKLIYYKSGVLGLSGGISSDFYVLETSEDPNAKSAIEVFRYNLKKHIGSLVAALGGLDALVFTAGVGENSVSLREEIASAFEFLGAKCDAEKNKHHSEVFSTSDSKVKLLVVPTNEEFIIAKNTLDIIG